MWARHARSARVWCTRVRRGLCTSSPVCAAKDRVALGEAIRRVMRTSAQPVALVSAFVPSGDPNDPSPHIHATTLSSFTTVSLAPPLVAFSIREPSRMTDALRAGVASPEPHPSESPDRLVQSAFARQPHFLIHILSFTQQSMSNFFARPGAQTYPTSHQHVPEDHPFRHHPMQPSLSLIHI